MFLVYQEAECEKEKMDVAYQAQTNIADSSREYQMQRAAFDQEVNSRKAESELSYELQVWSLCCIMVIKLNRVPRLIQEIGVILCLHGFRIDTLVMLTCISVNQSTPLFLKNNIQS